MTVLCSEIRDMTLSYYAQYDRQMLLWCSSFSRQNGLSQRRFQILDNDMRIGAMQAFRKVAKTTQVSNYVRLRVMLSNEPFWRVDPSSNVTSGAGSCVERQRYPSPIAGRLLAQASNVDLQPQRC